ncbi:MAG: lipid-A-disaccharide synthase [Planctomycetota bacterium]|nr:lipid-A-disaccharide synthase [Planctomycetota bacterium]
MADRPVIIFISAAEASGDQHAAGLIGAIRSRRADVRFVGAGGPHMAEAGCEVLLDLTKTASMLGGPLLKLGYYWRAVRRLQRAMLEIKPAVHVPVDSPALNWHLAATAGKLGAAVVYYIAPQVWAWAPWRVGKLARLTDRVACILPFEQEYLRGRGVNATYVGHPLFDLLPDRPASPPDPAEAWVDGAWRVTLLPGSRPAEIRNHAPALLAAADAIRRRWKNAQCTLTARTDQCAEAIRNSAGRRSAGLPEIAVGRTAQVLARSHFAVVASGTVTLEAAYFGVPMVIFYRTSRLLGAVRRVAGRRAVPTRHFSLVNILAGRRIVPELMPWYGDTKKLTETVVETMNDLGYLHEMRQDMLSVVEPLRAGAGRTACENAADIIVETLEEKLQT